MNKNIFLDKSLSESFKNKVRRDTILNLCFKVHGFMLLGTIMK